MAALGAKEASDVRRGTVGSRPTWQCAPESRVGSHPSQQCDVTTVEKVNVRFQAPVSDHDCQRNLDQRQHANKECGDWNRCHYAAPEFVVLVITDPAHLRE